MPIEVQISELDEPQECDRVGVLLVFSPGVEAEAVRRELRGLMGQGAFLPLESANVYRYNGEDGSPVFYIP